MRHATLKRLALLTGGLGAAAALVSAASFALFTSQAVPQTDSFAAGTVILTSSGGNNNCTPGGVILTNLEPGDSGTCTYTLLYSGSLNAWVDLNVADNTSWMTPVTPSGSMTQIGGEALLADSAGDAAGGAFQVSLSDSQHWLGTGAVPLPTVCPELDADGNSSFGNTIDCGAGALLLKTNHLCSGDCNNTPSGSWAPGDQDVVTLNWSLPLGSGNAYQHSSAVITLQGSAVQASNNPLPEGGNCPTYDNGQPTITGVQFGTVGVGMGITVNGCGFGTAPQGVPGNTDTQYFSFSDQTQTGSTPHGWGAGCYWPAWMPASLLYYCTPAGSSGANSVTLNYSSWSPTQITTSGFSGAYGYDDWVVASNDAVTIIVVNPQTHLYTVWSGTLP